MLNVYHVKDVQLESSPVTLMGSSGGRKGIFKSANVKSKDDNVEPPVEPPASIVVGATEGQGRTEETISH